jgi:hypothetical protein
MASPPPINQELEQAARAILETVRTTEDPERALVRVRFLLAKYGNDTVTGLAPLLEASAYFDCEKIALRNGATEVAKEIRKLGKLDQVQVTECKDEDICG